MIVHLCIGDGQVRDFHSQCLKAFNSGAGKSSLSGNTEFILLSDASGPQQIEIQAPLSSQPLAFDLLLGQE